MITGGWESVVRKKIPQDDEGVKKRRNICLYPPNHHLHKGQHLNDYENASCNLNLRRLRA